MADCNEQRRWKRIFLSSLLAIFKDEIIAAMAFSPVRYVTTSFNRIPLNNGLCDTMVGTRRDPESGNLSYKRQLSVIHMNDSINGYLISDDRIGHTSNPVDKSTRIKATLAKWSTPQLLSALNERRIRYAPTASRTDLENMFMDYLINKRSQKGTVDGKQQLTKGESSNPEKESEPQMDLEERMQKRAQRRHQQQSRRERFRSNVSNVLYSVAPSVTGKVLDYIKRSARRIKRQFSDFVLLDEETGIRDVVRYDYVRRDQINVMHALKSEVVLGPGDAIEVIFNDVPSQTSLLSETHDHSSSKRRDASSGNQYSTTEMRPSVDDVSSQRWDVGSDRLLLPQAANVYDDSSTQSTSFSSSNYAPAPKKRRTKRSTQDKKVYNPYATYGNDIMDNDKDAIDRVADFLTNAADQVFDRILLSDGVIRNNQANADTRRAADSQAPFDYTTTSPQPHRTDNYKYTKQRKHWKDRLEERLDSMLGLHENGDFYRSWTERYEHDKNVDDEPYDAFSVAQGRKPPKRRRKALYDKPFWEEDGNIFSLLLGRTKHYTKPRLDLRLGLQTGSLLSIFRFVLQNFMVVASYLCRWASTQGALPQPVVVFGVGSAMLCARPHRRLFAAGIALLLLRTVGEVLHGYVYGNSGWEEEEGTTTRNEKDEIQMEDEDF